MEFVKKNVMQVCHRLAITKDDKIKKYSIRLSLIFTKNVEQISTSTVGIFLVLFESF